jgi:endonuclease/exonuclease/phosphatase family metal-dependent hydrolase
VRVVTYNIRDGGEDYLEEIGAVLEQIQPDIVALQEANDDYVFNALASRLGFTAILGEGNHGYHVGILSRYPVLNWQNYANPFPFHHTLLRVELKTSLGEIAVFATHLHPGYTNGAEMHRLEEVELILNQLEQEKARRCILLGDFNAVSPQDILQLEDWALQWRIQILAQGGEISREALQRILDFGLVDCYRTFFPNNLTHPGYTLPAPKPNVRLDYIFINQALIKHLQNCQIWDKEPALQASDHLPVFADFGA